eukprot:Protomagalhaensia_sp_Gyna_25__797@NODE_1384_length_1892_cov_4_605505_g1113_i0_p1_GENE_NODE_1384_length_1892_cov_4_605505_g1113_i0NODE_1384_length_1892_cov_4_605505_g1113_i0_p1_ORF_typecomplete_len184_score37_59TPR_2/PF07719_17/1_4e02TPR_2/PF07719_17/0_06TPR_2/PF07719_17/0_00021TPR_16/PF13432_6/9_7e02TPR_16/PF13432_6/7_4e03TPR_16/PF13432_6/2_7e07TPR_9/PF13371_6/2_4e02TPR_9/PF13371_6/6_4e07TPR_1/PF00515_28/1_9e02TPR_1/PF00515_28/1_9e03TPR_1/PF00515_28/0_53TPR_1/PF00515_28/0_02TPR_19/PF14559_6/1_9e
MYDEFITTSIRLKEERREILDAFKGERESMSEDTNSQNHQDFEKALSVYNESKGTDFLPLLDCAKFMAMLLRQNKFDELDDIIHRLKTEKEKLLSEAGDQYFNNRDFPKARMEFSRGIQLNPSIPDLWVKRAWCHYWLSDFRESIFNFRRAMELDPKRLHTVQAIKQAASIRTPEKSILKPLD